MLIQHATEGVPAGVTPVPYGVGGNTPAASTTVTRPYVAFTPTVAVLTDDVVEVAEPQVLRPPASAEPRIPDSAGVLDAKAVPKADTTGPGAVMTRPAGLTTALR